MDEKQTECKPSEKPNLNTFLVGSEKMWMSAKWTKFSFISSLVYGRKWLEIIYF